MESMNQHFCPLPECGKSFKARKSLVEHMRIHNGDKPYQCHFEGCDKRFTQYSSMQKHERTHTGDKPYKCQICDRDFTQISNLKRHERVHAGEKPHPCQVCPKRFSTVSNLKQHMHVHQKGEARTKFLCRLCQKSYLYRSSLRKHLQEHGYDDSENIIDNNLFVEIKLEHEDSAYQNEQFMVKKEEAELYREPEISKYIFVDESQVIKPLRNELFEYKVEEQPQSSTDESQKDFVENQSTGSAPKMNLDLFPGSPSEYLFKSLEPEPESKMLLSLTSLLGSPLRDRDCKDNFWDRPKNSSSVIRYKGDTYYLYDRTLNRTKPNGELVMRQIDNDHVNPSNNWHRLPEISHYRDYQSLIKVYKEIVSKYSKCLTLEMLLSEKNCNSLICKGDCKSCELNEDHGYEKFIGGDSPAPFGEDMFFQQELSECPLEDNFCSRIAEEKTKNKDGHVCLCDITRKYKHVHGPNCGHPAIMHDGHVDYLVDGKLHHQEGDHCHDHGPIMVVENTSNEFAMSLISSNFQTDCKYSNDCKYPADYKYTTDYKYPTDYKCSLDFGF